LLRRDHFSLLEIDFACRRQRQRDHAALFTRDFLVCA
jgi:hypothetical protein